MIVTFGFFIDLIFSAKRAGFPSITSMTLIVGCFWSRAISWALSLGIRFINTPCWWSIYKFDKNVFGVVEEELLRKMKSEQPTRIRDTSFVCIVPMQTCFAQWLIEMWFTGSWVLVKIPFPIWLALGLIVSVFP